MMMFLLSLACLGVNQFENRYSDAFCAYASECEVLDLEGFSTMQACENQAKILPDDCEEFNRKNANSCLEQVTAMDCVAGQAGPPEVCDKICD